MKFQHRNQHVINLVFPIALFFVFAASALTYATNPEMLSKKIK